MESLGINFGLLLIQVAFFILFIGLPLIALIDISKKQMKGTPLALWVLIICVVPLLGTIAYWIIKPTAENKI